MKKENRTYTKDRHILIALDESENSKRALLYAADLLGGVSGFRVTLLSIIPEPSEDYFSTDKERSEWIKSHRSDITKILENYKKILIQSGFEENKVTAKVEIKPCPSIADCILEEQKKLGCCTIVLGRRGISKKEEFIFGSTTNKILHSEKSCAVWVVE